MSGQNRKNQGRKTAQIAQAMRVRPRLVNISIPHIFENVNTPDLLRYIPDDFLKESQKELKYKAVAETIRYTNDKNDSACLMSFGDGSVEYIVLKPENIKSAETVTYGDDGKVIPIS